MITVGTLPEQVPAHQMLGSAAYVDVEQLNIVKRSSGVFTGDVTVPSLNGNPVAGFKNLFINGNFAIWQRAASFTNPNNVFGADRWYMSVGTGTGTVSRQAFTAGQTAVPGDPEYFARLTASSATGQNLMSQHVEDVRLLSDRTVTLSFWIRGSSTYTLDANYPQVRQNFGVGGDTTVTVNNPGAVITVTPTWQKVVRTFTLPSVAGKTIGTSHSTIFLVARRDNLQIEFDLAQVQLEFGTVATDFETRSYAVEALLCQRYYYVLEVPVGSPMAVGHVATTTAAVFHVPFPVCMRVLPTVMTVTGAAADFAVQHANTTTVCSVIPSIGQSSRYSTRVQATVASGLTVGQGCALWVAANNPRLAFNAEI